MPTPHDMQSRLAELQQEYQRGEEQLKTLFQQEVELRETLMRIRGAIQVLDELLQYGPERGDSVPDGARRETRTDAEPVKAAAP
jgi:hypothetical protein